MHYEYKIIEAKDTSTLQKEITRHIKKEWRLHGGIVVVGEKICHAMVK